jgi:Flp pilus assembly protein TadG
VGAFVRQAAGVLRQDHRRDQPVAVIDRRRGAGLGRWREERASAAVEFALVLPLVLVMALALLQVGLLVKDRLVVEESARAGARQGAVTTDDAEVTRAATSAAVSLDPARLDVAVEREGGAGTPVRVTVVYHAPVSVPFVKWLFPAAIDLAATVIMRQETG